MRAATISSTASAPAARASQTCHGSRTKSLRSTGSAAASRASTRCVHAAAEERLVGEDRDRGRARGLVAPRHVGRGEVLADRPARGRAALVLGDHVHAAGARQGLAERAHRRTPAVTAGCEKPSGRRSCSAATRSRVRARIASRTEAGSGRSLTRGPPARGRAGGAARPSSIAAAAWRTPSRRSFAAARDHEGRGGVQEDDVALAAPARPRAPRARSPRSPAGRPRAAPRAGRREARVLGRDRERPHVVAVQRGDRRGPGERQLVEPAAVDDPRPLRPEPLQAARDEAARARPAARRPPGPPGGRGS